MAKNLGVWGIDMGVCSMKAIRLEMQDGKPVATHFDFIEHTKILSQPEVLQEQDKFIKEALLKFLSRNKVRGDQVLLSVSSQSGLARFVKLPPVEEKMIAEIVRFEAKQQIPFPLNEVVWDFQKLGSGMVIDGLALDSEIGLFAMKRDFIAKTLQNYRDVNIELNSVQMAPLSIINYVAFDVMNLNFKPDGSPAVESDEDSKKAVLALDIGTDVSNLILTDGGKIIEQRSISIGGSRFTKELSKEFKLTFAKAEHLKRTVAVAQGKDGPDLKAVITAIKPVFQDFVGELQRSLTYFSNRHKNVEFEYMVALGNGFKLHGLQRFLQEKLGVEIRKPGKFERLQGDAVVKAKNFSDNLLSFAVSYGLALQGLKQSRMTTNLLPPEIMAERQLKMKRPWAVAAAAAVLIGLSTYSLKNHLQARAWTDPSVKKSIKDSERVITSVAAGKKAFASAKDNVAKEESNVKSLLSGQDERFNWLELFTFLNEAIPSPDGVNLSDLQRKNYWQTLQNGKGGEVAHRELERRQTLSKDEFGNDGYEPGDTLGKHIDQLVEVNIESVDCRFTENLSGFWQQVKTGGKTEERKVKEDVRPLDHWEKSPDGSGWIVELRGYTFHSDSKKFLVEVLLENLSRFGTNLKAAPVANDPAAGATGLSDFGPVKNKISHILVYKYLTKKTNERSNFEIIGQSYLGNALRAGGFGDGAGGPGMGGPGMGGPGMGGPGMGSSDGGGAAAGGASRDSWQPVGATSSSSSGSARGGMMGGGPGGMMGGGPGESGSGGAASSAVASGARSNHTRTEFVIFFVWKEPTPSDAMRASGEAGEAGLAPPTPADAGAGAGLISTGPGKGFPRGVIDLSKKSVLERPRGKGPGNRPFWNPPAASAPPKSE